MCSWTCRPPWGRRIQQHCSGVGCDCTGSLGEEMRPPTPRTREKRGGEAERARKQGTAPGWAAVGPDPAIPQGGRGTDQGGALTRDRGTLSREGGVLTRPGEGALRLETHYEGGDTAGVGETGWGGEGRGLEGGRAGKILGEGTGRGRDKREGKLRGRERLGMGTREKPGAGVRLGRGHAPQLTC